MVFDGVISTFGGVSAIGFVSIDEDGDFGVVGSSFGGSGINKGWILVGF